jgi:uncharacterized protein (DUF934 family)
MSGLLLYRHGQLGVNDWQLLSDEAADETAAPVPDAKLILSFSRWLALGQPQHGVWLDNHENVDQLRDALPSIPLIALRFPVFTDGRAYSQARLLRQRLGYQGELRALGDVQRDQIAYMARCGFDTFLLRADQDAEECQAALIEIKMPVRYQT